MKGPVMVYETETQKLFKITQEEAEKFKSSGHYYEELEPPTNRDYDIVLPVTGKREVERHIARVQIPLMEDLKSRLSGNKLSVWVTSRYESNKNESSKDEQKEGKPDKSEHDGDELEAKSQAAGTPRMSVGEGIKV